MSSEKITPFDHYRRIYTGRSFQELHLLARIKRLMELVVGIPDFRTALLQKQAQEADALVKSYGLDIEMEKLTPLWKNGIRFHLPDEELGEYEHARLWCKWIDDLLRFRDLVREHGDCSGNASYNAWRRRQMARCDGELGDPSRVIVHANTAFELSSGCSVGCWFCGLKSESFQGYFERSPDNVRLWRETLEVFREYLGPALQTGFCYWATEPTDNPLYLEFINDFKDITGILPQTTTARATKDLEWTRRLILTHQEHRSVPARFSVLSPRMLLDIHKAFSPDELLGVELVQQHKGAVVNKARAGRILAEEGEVKEGDDPGTIACVSGFFVNMMEKRVQLVSPCRSSRRWPTGYRVHADGRFDSAVELKQWLVAATRECMPERPPLDALMCFRPDLVFEQIEDGFLLSNTVSKSRLTGGAYAEVGPLTARGDLTYDDIFSNLASTVDFFQLTGSLQTLFDRGLLDDGEDGNRFNGRSA